MTITEPPRLRTLVETRDARPPLIDIAAHDEAHPAPEFNCPWCPQSAVCPLCGFPPPECTDPSGHRRAAAGSEQTWREAA